MFLMEMVESLDRVSGIEKRSRAALIREAIAEYLRMKLIPEEEAAFGLWKQRGIDGVRYQNDYRDEWEKQ